MREHVFFHVTSMENVESIQKKGLLPEIGPRSVDYDETEPAIYLFPTKDDVDDALGSWLGEWYEDEDGLAILEVRLPPDFPVFRGNVEWEWLAKAPIPPACLSFYDEHGRALPETRPPFSVMGLYRLGNIFHVGTMDISLKSKFSHEGNGLSISNCPNVWRRITKGFTHGDCFHLTKPDMKLLDYHSLTNEEKDIIQAWAIREGYVTEGMLYKSISYGEEGEEYFSLYDTYERALEESDFEKDRVQPTPAPIPTQKLLDYSQVKVELLIVPDIIASLYAEQVLDYDGVYWDDELDVFSYSAPRGVIFNDKLSSFHISKFPQKSELDTIISSAQQRKENITNTGGIIYESVR